VAKEIAAAHQDAIKALFDKMDSNGNGKLELEEFKSVVSVYNGEAMDVGKFMDWYDCNAEPNGSLDLDEFGWYLADIAWNMKADKDGASGLMPVVISHFSKLADADPKARKADDGELTEMMAKEIAASHQDAIKALFDKLDANGNGTLEVEEFKGVVSAYNGEEVDVKQFMEWFDCNGTPNGTLDFDEFAWYIADVAWSLKAEFGNPKDKVPQVVVEFTRLAEAA